MKTTSVTFRSVHPGLELPTMTKEVTQDKITVNAVASLDYNPVHLDPGFTQRTKVLGETTVAHGMMTMSHMGSLVADWCYEGGAMIRKFETMFVAPVRPGDTVTYRGRVREKHVTDKDNGWIVVEVTAENQEGTIVATGEADVVFPGAGAKYKRNL